MIADSACISAPTTLAPFPTSGDIHVLIVARDARTRYVLSDRLLEAGLRVTLAATYGVVDVLLGGQAPFDLLIAAQSVEETRLFGMPQLVRSMNPDLPILVLDADTVDAPAVVMLAHQALTRWPLRELHAPAIH